MNNELKSFQHKRDSKGNTVLTQPFSVEGTFDYIQGDVTKDFGIRLSEVKV